MIIKVESGSNSWEGPNGTESREWTYKFDQNFNFLGGTETVDGRTIEWGPNWTNLGEKMDTGSLNLSIVSDAVLANLPSALKGPNDTKFLSESDGGNGEKFTYIDGDTDSVLGFARIFTEGTQVSRIFEDANGNYIGSRNSDEFGTSYNYESKTTTNPLDSGYTGGMLRVEVGGREDLQGNTLESWTYVYVESTGQFINGTETRDGVTTELGQDRSVTSQSVANLGSLPELDPAVPADLVEINKLPDALKVYDGSGNLAVIKINVENLGTDVRTSYIDGTGAILGYSNSFSDGFGSGIFYENANLEPLGNSFTSSDGFTSTFVKGVLTANGSVIGSTETITESEADGSYSRTSVMKFDTTGKMIGQTETITSGGATVVTEYDANNNIVGSFDGNGNLLDPLAVFQIGSMVFESGVEQAYADSLGNTMFIDDDGNGVNDVLEVDSDQNGITDIHEDYATYILNSAILSPSFKPEPIMSADGTSVTGFITANNEFYVQLNGTFQGGINSPPTGFVSEIIVKSSVISASGYDGADGVNYTGGSLISTSTGLNVDVSTLVAFIDSGSAGAGAWCWVALVVADYGVFDVLVDGDSPSTVNISVTASNNVFVIDGSAQQTLDLTEGNTYVFSYPAGHPFALSTTDDGTHGSGVEYTDGVVRDATGNTLTYTVPSDAPPLYYYCTDHSGMGGVANTPSPSDDGINWSADGDLILSGLLSGTFAPQPQPLVDAHDGSVIGVLVSDGHLYLKIVNSGDVVTAMTVNQVSDDSVVAKIDPSSNTLTTMTKLTSAFPRLDVSNVAVAGDTSAISTCIKCKCISRRV